MKIYFLQYCLIMMMFPSVSGQESPLALARPHYDNLLINSDNIIYVVAQQKKPVSLSQISAKYVHNSRSLDIQSVDGDFTIRPDSVGLIMISIKVKNKVSYQFLKAIEIPAIALISGHYRSYDTISATEMKKQFSIYPQVENYGFDIKCKIISYDILKVSSNNEAIKSKNIGNYFNDNSKEIIKNAKKGDTYFFYNIKCKCPGGNFELRLEDVVINIK